MFDPNTHCAPAQVLDETVSSSLSMAGGGVWLGLVSSGSAAVRAHEEDEPMLLCAGQLFAAARLTLLPSEPLHLLAVRLSGTAAEEFAASLADRVHLIAGTDCPEAAEGLARLAEGGLPGWQSGALAYSLLCQMAAAEAAPAHLPPLAAQAVESIHSHYAELYGVEELAESLGVSKSHLIRVFRAAMGLSPGQYLTRVRLDAAKQLLAHREYNLDVVASLCGFSGANYLCRVFKKVVGCSPRAWQASCPPPAAPLPGERELYI